MIELRNLSKSFVTADGPVDALKNVNLTINNGDIYGIIGMSGAGKSQAVKALEDIGYRGYLTIEREVGGNPAGDIKIAYDHLKKVMAEN